MTIFLRLLTDKDKATNLLSSCTALRAGDPDTRVFNVAPDSFGAMPGAPFAYWVSEAIRGAFNSYPSFELDERKARQGGVSGDDFRWLRLWYEQSKESSVLRKCVPICKGGSFSSFYLDVHLVARWDFDRNTFFSFTGLFHRPSLQPASFSFYFRPGLTWPLRTQSGLSLRAMPSGCIFGHKGPAAFVGEDDPEELLALLALTNSKAFGLLVSLQMAFGSYEVGVIQRTPIPPLPVVTRQQLATLARHAWSLKRQLDTSTETSHAFHLPAALANLPTADIEAQLASIQTEIDAIAFDLYGFSESDSQAALGASSPATSDSENYADAGDEEDDAEAAAPAQDGLLSWAIGVVFGRFDWRLATRERAAPVEPEPFDPLPAKSPGMLPDGVTPFLAHAGILIDDQGHPRDLARLIEEVLVRVEVPVPEDVRRWLQRDFFAFHLQRYSKSRRKAPIYWPLATTSGSHTLWLYYPSLTGQTLYTAINDFVEPKLKQVGADLTVLRNKGSARTRDDEKQFEALQAFELELIELRDSLLKLAPNYKPNHDDGVQISAAPLWPLFRHKPWQKLLKDTWTKLEKGDYDWAHLAMNYWPERVREKCKTDKSLAIAHGLESLYIEPEAQPKRARGRNKAGADV